MNMENIKVARVIATCFLPKRVVLNTLLAGNPLGYYYHSQNFTNTEDIINLLKFNLSIEKEIDPGTNRDLIIVNSDIGDERGNNFIDSVNGTKLKKGKVRVLHRQNIGLSFGAYSDAFKKFRDEYDYFIFTEDDLSITTNNYCSLGVSLFESELDSGFLAFVGLTKIKKGHWKKLDIQEDEAFGCHGVCGLSSKKVLSELFDKFGKFPHNQDDDYLEGISYGEVAIPLEIQRLGYKLIDQPKELYLAVPSYDLMRNIRIKKFPNFFEKLSFHLKSQIYSIVSKNKFILKIYLKMIIRLKNFS